MENKAKDDNWADAQLGELLLSLESGTRPKGGVRGIMEGIPSVGGEHLHDNGGFDFTNIKYVPKQFALKMNRGQIKTGDILIVKDGATTGRTSYVNGSFPYKQAVVNEHVFICRASSELNSKYLFYFLWSSKGKEKILQNFKGAAQGGINTGFTENTLVPIPPVSEQDRIVAKLDAIIQKVESNKKRLDKIPKLFKRFRQSVLAAAVSGKLTETWRADNGIDDEWEYMIATDACETVASGSTPKNNPFFEKEEIPYLKVYNIVNQKIDFFYKPQYIKRAIHEKELKRCKVYPNDVLINIVGPPLGKVALMPDTFPEWNINQAIVVFRPKEFLSPIFLYYILCDGKQIKNIELELRGTAGQQNISLTQCRNFDFPIPKPEEQKEIIRRVEQLFAFADRLEARYTKAKTMIDKLPQSILAKAFRGELVPQNPNDLPAPAQGKFFVYVLECVDGSWYKGFTTDILRRWKEHAAGKGAEHTQKFPPVKLIHWEEFDSEEKAVKREKFFKAGEGRAWLKQNEKLGKLRQAGEPASVLLERIKKEKEKMNGEKKKESSS